MKDTKVFSVLNIYARPIRNVHWTMKRTKARAHCTGDEKNDDKGKEV